MSNSNLLDIFEFTRLLNKFQEVERVTYVPGRERMENDVEHSYQLAMLAWYIVEKNSLSLDKNLVLKYALVHDFVEVYAGDTYIYSENQNDHDSKNEREENSRLRIAKEFPLFVDLHTTIKSYEEWNDRESCFVYVLDKIHPVLQNYLNNGKIWKERGITLEMLLEKKKGKMVFSPELLPYWDELEKILIENKDTLFYNN